MKKRPNGSPENLARQEVSIATSKEQKRHNRRIERLWRRGKITWQAFDWWLRTMSGV